jgi:hypothetical protein
MPYDAIFEDACGWLATATGSSPVPLAYLKLLGPHRGEWAEQVVANLGVVAARLRDRPDDWRSLIRNGNWRPTLIGCSAVSLVREGRFLDDLLYRFREGSWVAPQLAVALGLVHAAEAVREFEAVIREPDASIHVKRVFSAYAVLKLMGSEFVREFEASELFRRTQAVSAITSHEIHEAHVGIKAVQRHWVFWTSRSPD